MYQIEIARCTKSTNGHPGSFIILTLYKQLLVNRVSHGQPLSPASTHNASYAWPQTHQTCGTGTANHYIMAQRFSLRENISLQSQRERLGWRQRRTRYVRTTALRVVPTPTAPSVMCVGTVMKNFHY